MNLCLSVKLDRESVGYCLDVSDGPHEVSSSATVHTWPVNPASIARRDSQRLMHAAEVPSELLNIYCCEQPT